MHQSVETWVRAVVDRYRLRSWSVLEVGAAGDHGGYPFRLRDLFDGDYLGFDRDPGADEVWDAEEPFPWKAQVILCTEMLEHTPRPWRAVANMADALVPEGWLILSARGYDDHGCAPVHMEPHDYWRFSTKAVRIMLEDAGLTVRECIQDPDPLWRGVLAVAQRA